MGDLIWVEQPSGARFKGCACIRDSWPTITRLAVSRGLIRQQIDVTQGSYSTSVNASALTHAGGGVLDVQVTGAALDALLEECGIAAYERTTADGFKPHSHILWIGCPHLHAQAAAQVTSWRNLRNGLRSNTLDRDQTRPSPIRDWRQGLAWARLQLAQLEEDMPLTDADILKLLTTKINASGTTVGVALEAAARAASLPTATDTTDALLGKWLGASGPTVAVALQDSYHRSARQEAKVAALVDMLGSAGGGLDGAALERIADQAAEKAVRELGERLAGERPTEG